MDFLPPDDPAGLLLWARLQYLLAYSHEQAGETDRALAMYLSLIERVPDSVRSWFAWARLMPEP